jgi:hypothetical protein
MRALDSDATLQPIRGESLILVLLVSLALWAAILAVPCHWFR